MSELAQRVSDELWAKAKAFGLKEVITAIELHLCERAMENASQNISGAAKLLKTKRTTFASKVLKFQAINSRQGH